MHVSANTLIDDCRNGNGRYYLGTVNVTKSGLPCQRWDVQYPHKHIQPPQVFPQIAHGENYCRNAGGEEPYPWCYTLDVSVRWQHCDIPLCRKYKCNKIKLFHFNTHYTQFYSRLY